jgi:hypothetical protein
MLASDKVVLVSNDASLGCKPSKYVTEACSSCTCANRLSVSARVLLDRSDVLSSLNSASCRRAWHALSCRIMWSLCSAIVVAALLIRVKSSCTLKFQSLQIRNALCSESLRTQQVTHRQASLQASVQVIDGMSKRAVGLSKVVKPQSSQRNSDSKYPYGTECEAAAVALVQRSLLVARQ